jgi:PIN domain nuclease of toxin-antitoxin system
MIVIDTHVWVWWQADPKRLSKKAARALKNAKSIGIPAICLWEFSMLVQRDRIRIDRSALEWLNDALDVPGVRIVELTPSVAVQSTRLPSTFHNNPADRLIVATALNEGAPLISADQKFVDIPGLELIWD